MKRIIGLLEKEYGRLKWHPDGKPLACLVRTILSQNTSDANSGRAFNELVSTFGSWEAVASAPVEDITRAIREGGLSGTKAARIKEILNRVKREHGRISFDFLDSLSTFEAKNYLLRLHGVGEKTANCVLLLSLGKPCLPVDTHIFRVSGRLGLIDAGVSVEKAHHLLEQQVPPSMVYQFHIHMMRHGRQVCRARNPLCDKCVLKGRCPSAPSPPVAAKNP